MNDKQIQAVVDALQGQRNAALNAVVTLQSEIAGLTDQVEVLTKELEDMTKKYNSLLPPHEDFSELPTKKR